MESALDALRFTASAVNAKSPVTEMTHFLIDNGQVRTTDGTLSLGSPIDLDLSCAPHADTLMRAVKSCSDVVSLTLTPGGRLSVKSSKFKALVPCISVDDCSYHQKPSGMPADIPGDVILKAFNRLAPFVATDGLRPWANGIMLRGSSAFATNNVVLVEAWLGAELPLTANIPLSAVKAVIAQKQPPTRVTMDAQSITFFYESGRWIKTLLYEDDWPPVERILNEDCDPKPLPDELFNGANAISKFASGDKVYFRNGSMCSSPHDEEGATYQVQGLAENGKYNIEALKLLQGVATQADFDRYPKNALFFGENIRGVLIGFN